MAGSQIGLSFCRNSRKTEVKDRKSKEMFFLIERGKSILERRKQVIEQFGSRDATYYEYTFGNPLIMCVTPISKKGTL